MCIQTHIEYVDYNVWVGDLSDPMPKVDMGDSLHEPVGWIKTVIQINEMGMVKQNPNKWCK